MPEDDSKIYFFVRGLCLPDRFDDPKATEEDAVYDWKPNQKDKEDMSTNLLMLAGPDESEGFGSEAEEELEDDDEVAGTAAEAKPRRGKKARTSK